jgi:hypothetical protein
MKQAKPIGRRNLLKAAGAGLVAVAVPAAAAGAVTGAQASAEDEAGQGLAESESHHGPQPIYLYGCGWNRDLPGVFGQLCLTFDVRAEVGGTGLGTLRDDVHPEVNSQVQINSATRHGKMYTLKGEIVASADASMLGLPVKFVAEKTGTGTGKATITVGTEGQDLVVIAIIAVIIGLLLPAIQS